MNTRTAMRFAVLGAAIASVVLAGSPALARIEDDGAEPGPGLTVLETILIFGVVPLGLFFLIALLVLVPSIARGPRYRTDRRWNAQPRVFGAPDDALSDEHQERPTSQQGEPGGSSARW